MLSFSAALLCWTLLLNEGYPAGLEPTGQEQKPARVIVVQDPRASEAFRVDAERVQALMERGVKALAGKGDFGAAFRTLVSTQDVVGIKVYSLPGPNTGTRPAVVAAVVKGLLAAGLPPTNIIIWDRHAVDLRLAGFYDLADRYGVQVAGAAQAGYDASSFYENPLLGNLVWGDSEFGKRGEGVGRKSYVSKLVKEMTRIINVTPMLNHNLVGVSGNLFSLAMGSVDNTLRFEADRDRLATALPEIYALPALSDKVVLNVVDALICQYEGGERGLLHYSAALNELRLSTDPVALDVLSVNDLDRLRGSSRFPRQQNGANTLDVYSNAALLELGTCDLAKIRVEKVL